MRLVLDTDVLVAGLRSRSGAAWILLLAVDAGVVRPLVTVATVLEYEAVLTRPEQLNAMRFTHSPRLNTFLDDFVVSPTKFRRTTVTVE